MIKQRAYIPPLPHLYLTDEVLDDAVESILTPTKTLNFTVRILSLCFNELPENVEAKLRALLPEGFGADQFSDSK